MSVWKYVKVDGVWRYKRAIEDKGKIIPNMVRVDGKVEFHEEGTYYFRSGRQWIRLDAMPTSTLEARELLQAHDLAVKHGIVAADQPTQSSCLRDAIEPYLEGYAPGHQTKTVKGLRTTLNEFVAVIGNKRLSAVTKDDVKRFWQRVVDDSPTNSWRTAYNECNKVRMFLVEHGVDVIGKGKNGKGEKRWRIPKFVEETPETYDEQETERFFALCDPRQKAAYSTMLMGLFREKEVVYLTWDCVDVAQSVLKVKAKPQYKWKPKKAHERDVKVPRGLMNMIVALPKQAPLVFPRRDGKPDLKLWRKAKQIARKAGLDTDHVWLHKFRATGATRYFQKGMPLPDIMALGGWRDMKSVMRYMGRLRDDKLTAAVEAAWA
jgi:integrase